MKKNKYKVNFFTIAIIIILFTFIQGVNGALSDNAVISNGFNNVNLSLSDYGINATYNSGVSRFTSQYYTSDASMKPNTISTQGNGLWFPYQFNQGDDFSICAYVNITNSTNACSGAGTFGNTLFQLHDRTSGRLIVQVCDSQISLQMCVAGSCWINKVSGITPILNQYKPLCFIYDYTSGTSANYSLYYNNTYNSSVLNWLYDNTYTTGVSIGSASATASTKSTNQTYVDNFNVFNKAINTTEVNTFVSIPYYPYTIASLPVWINQTPSDINSLNVIGNPVIIYYNFSGLSSNNSKLEYGHIGMEEIVNGTLQPIYSNSSYTNITGDYVRFQLDDNDVYGGTFPVDTQTQEETSHLTYSFSGTNNLIKLELLNVSASKNYNIFEIMANGTNTYSLFYCNSSYTTGNPTTSGNCVQFGTGGNVGFNHTHNNSKHNIFSMNIVSGFIGGVRVSSTSYFIIKPTSTNVINIGYTTQRSTTNNFMTSNNNGGSYSVLGNFSADFHLHQYLGVGLSENLTYRAVSETGSYSTPLIIDNIGLALLPPTPPIVNNVSLVYTYNTTINLTWAPSTTQNESKILYYNITLIDKYSNVVKNYGANTSNNTIQINLNGIEYYDNFNYKFRVVATDNNSLTSQGLSNAFHVISILYSPCNMSFTSNSSGSTLFFNWSTDAIITETLVKGKYKNVSFDFYTDTQGSNTFVGFNHGLYYLYFNQTYNTSNNTQYFSDCTLDVCVSNWVKQIAVPCVNDLRLIVYNDSNSCSPIYDVPSDYGLYDDCTTPSKTDKELWLLIFLLVIWIITLVLTLWIAPLLIITSFLSGVALTYYFNSYFTSGGVIIGLVILVCTTMIMLVSILVKRK